MDPVLDNGISGFYGTENYTDFAASFDANPVGYANDGTFITPASAQPVNNPQNTAGYSSSISPAVAGLLSQGIGVLGKLGIANMQLDYARAEAMNGGLYYQGRYAGISRNGFGQINQPMNLSVLLIIGGLAYILLKD